MRSAITLSTILFIVSFVSVGFAQEGSASDTAEQGFDFPYVAQITSDNVNIRSGPGTNYYRCGKLAKDDRVEIVGRQFSWSRIVPTEGSFSWISTQYVRVSTDDASVGIVTGQDVRVYAGSEELKPMHSTTVQLKLNENDKVELLGEQQDGYHKIVPPEGAYLWISTEYAKPLGPVGKFKASVKSASAAAEPLEAEAAAVTEPAEASAETGKLEEYYELEKKMQAEREKPWAQQNYSDVKKALLEIAGNKQAGKAARYSEFAIKQIERFELAVCAGEQLKLQDEKLEKINKSIEKARVAKLAEVKDVGVFDAIGSFQKSHVYGPEEELQRYRLVDDAGSTICYAVPAGVALKLDLDKFTGSKVGLVGTIKPNPETSSALIKFTEITNIK